MTVTTTAYDRLVDALKTAGRDVDYGKGKAQCPSHDDGKPSLSIRPRQKGGGVVVHCHAGCDTREVLQALGLAMADLFDEPKVRRIYEPRRDYHYPGGRVVHRKPGKDFPQSGNKADRSLYGSDGITDAATTVYVVEGEKDVEAVQAAGGIGVCSAMGAGKAHLADWSPLAGKSVVVIADKDKPGREHAAKITELLNGIATSVRVVEAIVGKDFADQFAADKALDEFAEEDKSVDVADEDKPARRSVAAQIVDLGRSAYTLGVTDTDDPFGVTKDRPHIAMMLRGGKSGLRAELSRQFFALTNTVPSQQALADACMVLEGFAAQENPQRVYLRVAELGGAVYIDMGDTTGRLVEISAGKWRIVDTAPVLFRRTKLTGELPHPHPGDLSVLWDFVSVDIADRPVLLAVLVAALIQVDVPHPILTLLAEQGSAKSTITRILVSLIDPSAVPLRQPPRDPDGWTTAAAASWVVALDNLSGTVSSWLSDCLCRASTGDGSVKRALYTDHDVAVMAYRRCVIVNGVDLIVDRGDLAERVVVVDLRRVQTRRAEDELAAAWAAAHPGVLSGLLDLAAKVHQHLPAVEVPDLPRMADFAKVLAGVDEVLGTTGLARYRERAKQSAGDTLDAPLIAELVTAGRSFDGSSSAEVLFYLTPANDTGWRRPRGWPKNARAVTGLLTRHAPALRALGWTVENDQGRNRQNVTKWTITPPEPEKGGISTSRGSPSSQPQVSALIPREAGEAVEASASYGEVEASQAESPTSHENTPPTSDNEAASHASHVPSPSLVLSSPDDTPPPGGLIPTSPGQTTRVQQILAKHQRAATFCSGCGTYFDTHSEHRTDCTARRQVIDEKLATLTLQGDSA